MTGLTLQAKLILEGIARGEKAVLDGRTLTHKEACKRFSRWLSE